jgi:uncharacterized membrane protein
MTDPFIRPKPSVRPNRDRRKYDEFHETLVTPIPNHQYQNHVEDDNADTLASARVVRFLAALLIVLLAMRFVANLFSLNRSGDWVTFFYLTTNWAVSPFQNLFGQSSLVNPYGSIDWPALAAIAVTGLIAWAVWKTFKAKSQ